MLLALSLISVLPNQCTYTAPKVQAAIQNRAVFLRGKYRRTVAKQLGKAIHLEYKRSGFDPALLLAIAKVESNYKTWSKGVPGRRAGEVG